jgi:hypothetical protein
MNPLLVQEAAAALLSSAGRSGLKNLLSMIAAGVLIFAGLGYYLDWYKIQATPGPNGSENVTLNVNRNEIKKDIAIVRDRAGQLIKSTGYAAPTQPGYPQQNPYQQTQYPAQPYPQQQPYAPAYTQQPQQPGYYPPAGTYPPQQGGWVPAQPTNRPAYQQPAPRPF